MAHLAVFSSFSSAFPLYPHYLLLDHSHHPPLPLAVISHAVDVDAAGKAVQILGIQFPTLLGLDTTEPLYAEELFGGVI